MKHMGVEMIGYRIRPKEQNVSLPVTCQIILGSVGRQIFLYIDLVTFWIEV